MRRMTRLVTWSLLAALVLTPVLPVRAQNISPNLTGVLGPGGMIWYSAASQIVSNTTAATALFSYRTSRIAQSQSPFPFTCPAPL